MDTISFGWDTFQLGHGFHKNERADVESIELINMRLDAIHKVLAPVGPWSLAVGLSTPGWPFEEVGAPSWFMARMHDTDTVVDGSDLWGVWSDGTNLVVGVFDTSSGALTHSLELAYSNSDFPYPYPAQIRAGQWFSGGAVLDTYVGPAEVDPDVQAAIVVTSTPPDETSASGGALTAPDLDAGPFGVHTALHQSRGWAIVPEPLVYDDGADGQRLNPRFLMYSGPGYDLTSSGWEDLNYILAPGPVRGLVSLNDYLLIWTDSGEWFVLYGEGNPANSSLVQLGHRPVPMHGTIPVLYQGRLWYLDRGGDNLVSIDLSLEWETQSTLHVGFERTALAAPVARCAQANFALERLILGRRDDPQEYLVLSEGTLYLERYDIDDTIIESTITLDQSDGLGTEYLIVKREEAEEA